MSDHTAQLVDHLRSRLRHALRRMTWAELAFGGAVAVGALTAFWLVAAVLEATLWLQPTLRTGLLLLGGALLLGIGATFVARPLGRLVCLLDGPSDEEIARAVGEHDPVVADRLVNLLQLADGQRSHAPAPYVDRAVQHLAQQIDDAQFDAVADFDPAHTAARWAALPLLAVVAFLGAAPSTFLNASERLLAPQTEFERPAPFQFSVSPRSAQLVKGDSLGITVRTTGRAPETATLLLRSSDDESPERIALTADTTGTFRHLVPNVRQSLRYRVVASPVRTEWFDVEVANRPFLRQLQLRVTPPAYTGRTSRKLAPNVGNVTALPGSEVTVAAALGGAPVADASLQFENGPTQSLTVTDDSATGTVRLRREDTYVVHLQSDEQIPNRDPIRYEVALQSDARPSVSFLTPQGSAELTPDLTQELRLQLSDDYGFRRVALFYRRTNGAATDSSFDSFELPLSSTQQTDQVLAHTWLLAQESNLDLERGDEVAYYVKAWDNDTVNGPKSGRTATQRLRFPSLTEQYEELDTLQEETGDQMRQLDRDSRSIEQQFKELRDELRRTREGDWEDRRQLEQLQQKQESLSKNKDQLSRKVDSLNREMQRKNLSSPETAEKLQELSRTMDEMNSENLQKALQKMKQSMENQSFRQMQSSMESAKSRLEQQQQQLERTMEMFEQIKAQQKMEEMSRRAQDLSERESEVAKKTEERMESSETADSTAQSDTPSDEQSRPPSDSLSSEDRRPSADSSGAQRDSSSASSADSTSASASDSLSTERAPADSSANEDLAREQEELAKELEKLMETMKNAEQDMKDVPSAPQKKLQQMREQMQQQDMPQEMRENSQQLRQNQLQKARQQQQRLQKQMQSMQSQLSQMQQQMQSQQQQMNMTGLRNALENTLRLSQSQESLRTTLEDLTTGEGPTVRRYARQQQDLSDGLQNVADSLQSIASRLPRMSSAVQKETGNALRAMEQATSSLDERSADQATGFQKTSMKHLNELALLLSDLMDQMQQQGGGGGQMSMQQAMQQLQKASGQQQKLNQQIQQFLNKAQGERLSKDMEARRKQLAKQQRQIKQQLEEMDIGEETKQQLMGDLQKIADQMEESADDLQGGRHSRDLINRQQQILTRLLNAQQSLRTQGKKQERRGQQAEEDVDRERPGERPAQDDADSLRRDLIRALEMGYTSDYEQLIKRYFELLKESEASEQEP